MGTIGEGYSTPGQQVQSQVNQTGHAGTLPFTGADLGGVGAAGLVLVVLGVTLWRATREKSATSGQDG